MTEVIHLATSVKASRRPTASASQIQEAVVLLRPDAKGRVPPPSTSVRMAKAVLRKAEKASGTSASASQIFDAMHSLSVRAPKSFIDALREVQEVAQVLPNQMAGSALIEPVKRTRVTLPK